MTNNLCDFLDWDSQFFNLNIARANTQSLDANLLNQIESWCIEQSIDCLYFQTNADDNKTIRIAENHGFNLVEVRMTYERTLKGWENQTHPHIPPEIHVRPARPEDVPVLQSFSENAFIHTRYYADEHFPREKCHQLYKLWVKRNCEGYAQLALVAESDGQLQGYLTGFKSSTEPTGQFDLTGVRKGVRRGGIGHALLRTGLDWYARQGIEYVWAITQGANIATQVLVQRNGFIARSCQLYYHKWFT